MTRENKLLQLMSKKTHSHGSTCLHVSRSEIDFILVTWNPKSMHSKGCRPYTTKPVVITKVALITLNGV